MVWAKWGSGNAPAATEVLSREERNDARRQREYMRSANQAFRTTGYEDAYLEPGQFIARHPLRCDECDDMIARGDAAGYNAEDQIVCTNCWIPFNER